MSGTRTCLCCRLPRWGATLFGAVALVVALGAGELGIDKNAEWGPRRLTLLLGGAILLVVAQWSPIERAVSRRLALWRLQPVALGRHGGGRAGDEESAPPTPPMASALATMDPLSRWQKLSLLTVIALVELVYVWFASVGHWGDWPKGSSYYDLLADGFIQGRTSLVVEPDPRLLQIVDPYSMEGRSDIPVLWDVSFFDGKYQLYWGPAPAVGLILPKLLLRREIPDVCIVFAATSLMLAASTAILVWLWKRFFSDRIPFWLMPAAVFLVGLGPPALWVLGGANVYEAAGSSGTAALLASSYLALPLFALEGSSRRRLAGIGLCLGIVVASRLALGIAASGLVVLALAHLAWRRKNRQEFALDTTCLLVPLAIIGIMLAWYNFDRFGNILETGFRYQLTNRTASMDAVFDVWYIIPNAYNYLLQHFRTISVFPFIKPIPGVESVPLLPVNIHPPMYTTQHVTGILLTVPATLWTIFLAWWAACGRTCYWSGVERTEPGRRLRAVTISLLILAVLAFLPTGFYHFVANRYQMDFMPFVLILSALGAWLAVRRPRPRLTGTVLRAVVAASFVTSIVMTFLLAVSGDQYPFERLNPELFEWMTRLLA